MLSGSVVAGVLVLLGIQALLLLEQRQCWTSCAIDVGTFAGFGVKAAGVRAAGLGAVGVGAVSATGSVFAGAAGVNSLPTSFKLSVPRYSYNP